MKQRTAVKAVEDALQHIKMYITAGAWAKTAKEYYVEEPWSHSISKKDLQKFIVLLKLKNSPPPNVARVQIPAWCHMWDEFIAGSLLCSERCFFLRALRFSSLLKNQHFQISIRPGIAVLPPTRYLFIYFSYLFIVFFCCFSYRAPVKWIAPSAMTMKCVFQITKITMCDVFVRLDIQEHLAVSYIKNMAMS